MIRFLKNSIIYWLLLLIRFKKDINILVVINTVFKEYQV